MCVLHIKTATQNPSETRLGVGVPVLTLRRSGNLVNRAAKGHISFVDCLSLAVLLVCSQRCLQFPSSYQMYHSLPQALELEDERPVQPSHVWPVHERPETNAAQLSGKKLCVVFDFYMYQKSLESVKNQSCI